MQTHIARGIGSTAVFAICLFVMLIACIGMWDGFVNGKIYYCTDGGSMDFICPGDWVHHPESVAQIVPHSMSQPDEIKNGWSIAGLWNLWFGFVGVSMAASIFSARTVWIMSKPKGMVRSQVVNADETLRPVTKQA
jgi:hypothetical protein